MRPTKHELSHRVLEIDDLAKATLDALVRENRMLGHAMAAMGFGAGLALAGGIVLALDIWDVFAWPLAVLAVVSGVIGIGAALAVLSAWQWRSGEKRIRKLEAKLHAAWYIQRETALTPPGDPEPEPLPLPPAKEPFGRKHVTDAQEAAEELLRRVMLRSKGQG